jgi:hypothetical protein
MAVIVVDSKVLCAIADRGGESILNTLDAGLRLRLRHTAIVLLNTLEVLN